VKVRRSETDVLPLSYTVTVVILFGGMSSRCFVTDLDDDRPYTAHAKPHANPLDFPINAFYFLPATLHAVALSGRQKSLANTVLLLDRSQFDDAD